MFPWNSLQIIIDDHLDILYNRLIEEDLIEGFIIPKIKEYYVNILVAFALFSIVYICLHPFQEYVWKNKSYLRLSDHKKKDWNSRIIAFTHAIIISPFCVSLIFLYGFPWNKTEYQYDEKEVDLYYKAISISIGYFMWDIIYSISDYKKGGVAFIVHGVCAFLIYIFTFKHPVLGHYAILYLNYELSTIFLNIYWILDKLNLTGSILQLVNALLLLVTFFCVRIAFGSITVTKLLYDLFFERRFCSVYLVIYFFINIVPMQLLNYIWFYKMIKSVFKHFDKPNKIKTEKKTSKKS